LAILEAWLEFGKGPLFRFCFALMILGLTRIVFLTGVNVAEAYRRNADKILPYREIFRQTLAWMFPVRRLISKRPVYSLVSFCFHLGLILTPLFLTAHVRLWKNSTGVGWLHLPQTTADILTLLTICGGFGLFLMRALYPPARTLSRKQDYLWPLLLICPFLTGFICSNIAVSPSLYGTMMLIHIYSADLIMVLIPFTKVAHCVLAPLSQVVTGVSWKFPAGAGDRVIETLGHRDRPSWLEKSRLHLQPLNLPESQSQPVKTEGVAVE
jgi:nitrate reductase gamma subunit